MSPELGGGQGEGVNKQKDLITLPARDEMLQRLKQADDSPYLEERFYPHLLQHAGRPKYPQGVVMLLTLAISDYMQGMPPQAAVGIMMNADAFIDALVPDPKAAEETKRLWSQANSESQT